MISLFRRYLESWPARILFGLMVLAFVFWGVDDMVRLVNNATWAIKTTDTTIEAKTLDAEFRRDLAAASRDLPQGKEISAEMRRQVADRTVRRVIDQAALAAELKTMHIAVPIEAVLDAIRAMPVFKGANGAFDKARFESALRANGLTEAGLVQLMRADMASRQVIDAIAAGARVPTVQTVPIFEAQFEKRSADIAAFPFAAMPEPPVPDDAAVRRWYDNHIDLYASPEIRRIRLAVVSPRTASADIAVADKELVAAYEQNRTEYTKIAKRSAEVISASDEAKATALADAWKAGATWAAMETAAKQAGASAIEQTDATQEQFPDPDLAKAVFAAPIDTVSAPIKGALGWFVIKVTAAAEGGTAPFDDIKDQLKQRLVTERALEIVYDRANKIDGQMANGATLDTLAADPIVAVATVTVDRRGFAPDQSFVEIPGETEIRTALLAAAFDAAKGDPPRLTEVQTPSTGGSGYYAMTVEDVVPSASKSFETVRDTAAADWQTDRRRRTAEEAAAGMLAAVKAGKDFSDAARDAGVIPVLSPVVTRTKTDPGLPVEVHRVLFGLKKREATMIETPDGFLVAAPVEIVAPDPAAEPLAVEQTRTAIRRSVINDIVSVYAGALRQRANPRINQANIDQIVQP